MMMNAIAVCISAKQKLFLRISMALFLCQVIKESISLVYV